MQADLQKVEHWSTQMSYTAEALLKPARHIPAPPQGGRNAEQLAPLYGTNCAGSPLTGIVCTVRTHPSDNWVGTCSSI